MRRFEAETVTAALSQAGMDFALYLVPMAACRLIRERTGHGQSLVRHLN